MAETNKNKLQNVLSMFNTWYKICALLLCLGVALSGLGFAVQQGALTPDQAQGLITQLADSLNERVDAINASLQQSWNPTFYTTSSPYTYVISALPKTGGGFYYCLQNGTTGQLKAYNETQATIQTAAVDALTNGGSIYLNNLTWIASVAIPSNIGVTENYLGVLTYYGNTAATQPQGAYTYMIYVDPTNSSLYNAKHANGTIYFTSTNQTALLVNIANAADVGSIVAVQNNILSSYGSASLIVANVSESTTAGQVVYYKINDQQYPLAISESVSELGFGDCNIAVINSTANTKCLLLKDGYFTLASWDWDAGWVYVSNDTAGSLEQTPHEVSGEPDLAIGIVINDDTIKTVPLILIEQP